jgi:hypothetical protein
MTIQIIKQVSRHQPYARNGNVGMQKLRHDWHLAINGRVVETFALLRLAKIAAKDYSSSKPVICEQVTA